MNFDPFFIVIIINYHIHYFATVRLSNNFSIELLILRIELWPENPALHLHKLADRNFYSLLLSLLWIKWDEKRKNTRSPLTFHFVCLRRCIDYIFCLWWPFHEIFRYVILHTNIYVIYKCSHVSNFCRVPLPPPPEEKNRIALLPSIFYQDKFELEMMWQRFYEMKMMLAKCRIDFSTNERTHTLPYQQHLIWCFIFVASTRNAYMGIYLITHIGVYLAAHERILTWFWSLCDTLWLSFIIISVYVCVKLHFCGYVGSTSHRPSHPIFHYYIILDAYLYTTQRGTGMCTWWL